MEHYDVVIAGGGYAGVMCALRLAGKMVGQPIRIALINPAAHFVERLRLHEGIVEPARRRLRSFDIAALLGRRGVAFIPGKVVALDRTAWTATVERSNGQTIEIGYDRFVAAGGTVNRTDMIEGADRHAYVLDPSGDRNAAALHRRLAEEPARRVLVIGAGVTGIELAAEIAQRPGISVTLASAGAFAPFAADALRALLRRELESLEVGVMITRVRRLSANLAHTDSGEIAFDVCAVCAGFQAPPFLGESGLETNQAGRVLTDPYLRACNDGRIYAAGDCCLPVGPVGAPPRMSVPFALTTGAHVAEAIAAELTNRRPRRFGFWTFGQAIGLGNRAVGFSLTPHDTPFRPYFAGRVAFHLRAFFVRLLFSILRAEKGRRPRLPFWIGRPLRRAKRQERKSDARLVGERN